ncbi:hypothetical protein PVL29_009302 [Vitis rotundifolia]|uniref:non-specific serine/threonine protein kinase n=1 Tax=Vitis rotundifolia TaxID=103349 RepID=A0AA39DVV1_VITRO|nr:hypothetical protein PVL29_009302 [Vitis rotundifolia]
MEDSSTPMLLLTFTYLSLSLSANTTTADEAAFMTKLAAALSPTPSGWSGTNHCKWSGVKCDAIGQVVSINLASRSLSGVLPSDINQLPQLQALSLQKNQLSGPLPSLSNLTSLQSVFLDNNNFSSVPPEFLLGLNNLQTFSIRENPSLQPWRIPEHLSESTSLASLLASNANIFGTIPDIFGSFPNLQSVRLSYNNLTGPLPPSFGGSGIQNLWLNNQKVGLSGRLDVLGAMVQLSQAWLHANAFSGPIPDLSNSSAIFDLQLRDNQLTGVLLPSLFSHPRLVNISLQNNKLQGPYPNFSKTVEVTLGSTNNFCNPQPGPCDPQVTALLEVAKALGYPMLLAQSWEGNDACKGWSFISCDAQGKNVTIVNFGKQEWSGSISPAFANLTSLRNLLLNDNDLSGTLPASLTSLKELRILDISNNNLSGSLPHFPSTVTVKAQGNNLLGTNSTSAGDGGASGSGNSDTTPTTTPSKAGSSSSSPGFFVSVIVGSAVFMGIVSLVIYGLYAKRRHRKLVMSKRSLKRKGSVRSLITGKANGNGTSGSDSHNQSSTSGDMHVYDGGNVAIPIEVLRQVTNNFDEANILGKGGFGVVYRGELHDGTQIAVKRMESAIVGTKGMSEFQAEIGVLTKVRHRHLVALLGFCINGNERLLVYEYMPQGTLGQHLFEYNKTGFSPLTWKQRITIALDVAKGMEYLHSLAQQSFIHRDLKPSNILLGTDMRAKVSDFGLVKNAPDGKYSVETRLAGTFGYLAPEYAATGRVTIKVDVFAFGVVLMEMITGRKSLDEALPEEKSHLVSWFRRVLPNPDNIRDALDPSLRPDEETFGSICKVAELAGHCTAREPHQRPDMSHAVNVLSHLLDEWKPSADDEEEDNFGIDDFNLSLPQALERWQANEGTSSMTLNLYNSGAQSIPKKRSASHSLDQQ